MDWGVSEVLTSVRGPNMRRGLARVGFPASSRCVHLGWRQHLHTGSVCGDLDGQGRTAWGM